MRFFFSLIFLFSTSINAVEKSPDLNFEQALYEHLQERYLDAITLSELLTEKNKTTSIQQQVLLSQSYFRYRLPQTSLSILEQQLGGDASKADQDILLFHIGKNQFDNQQLDTAKITLNKIVAPVNPIIVHQLNYILGNIYIRHDELGLAENQVLLLQNNTEYFPFIAHNLAIALLNKNQTQKALIWIDVLNKEPYHQHQSLKDSLLLALGISYLRDKKFTEAIKQLLKITKQSHYSAKGLLALGSALIADNKMTEGARFYNYLSNYPKQNLYYQESLLTLAESNQDQAAKQLLKHAISNYNALLNDLKHLNSDNQHYSDCFLNSAKKQPSEFCKDTLLWTKSLVRSVSYQSITLQQQQLIDIQIQLNTWSKKLPVYQFILTQRKDDFDNKLPTINSKFNPKQLANLKQQFAELKDQVTELKQSNDLFSLITENEADHLDDVQYVEVTIKRINKEAIEGLQERALFTKGILMWELAQKKPARLRQASKNINDIEQLLMASAKGIKKLKQFNDFGDLRLSRLNKSLEETKRALKQLSTSVEQLIKQNKNQLTALTRDYLLKRRATLIQLNSRSKYLLTELQDVQK